MKRLLKTDVHASWFVASAFMAIVCGVVIAGEVPSGVFGSIAWLFAGIVLIPFAIWRKKAAYVGVAVTGGFLVGLWRGSSTLAELDAYANLMNKTVTIMGTVEEDSDINKHGELVFKLTQVSISEYHLGGSVWVTTDDSMGNRKIQRGDTIALHGKLTPGFGNVVATIYRAKIVSVRKASPSDIALTVRDWFADAVHKAVPEPEASLGLGYVVGQRKGLSHDFDDALRAAGLTHIVVASGYNLTILVRLARRLFEKISKYLSLITSLGMVGFFVAITGLSPSMTRAGLVASLGLLAWYYGRRFHPLVLLATAMGITVLWQPNYAWGDLGWQLSFAAFAGVMILAPLMNTYFFGDKKDRTLRRIFIETIAAQICTLPILLTAFGQYSVVAPIANIIVLPFVPLTMLLTFIAGLGGIIFPTFAMYIGFPAQAILSYMIDAVLFVGEIPWALQQLKVSSIWMILSYGCIGASCWYMWYRTRLDLRNTSLVE